VLICNVELHKLTLPGRLLPVDSTKSFLDFNEIWYVGQWVMHDGMQYDLIQGQVQVTAYGRQSVPDMGVVRSCDPLQNFGATIISLERLNLKSSNFVHE